MQKHFAKCVLKIKNLREKLRKFFLFLENLLTVKKPCSVPLCSTPQGLLHPPKALAHNQNASAPPLVWATRAPHARYLWCVCNLYVWVISLFSPRSTPTRGALFGSTATAVMGQKCPTRLRLALKTERNFFL